MKITSPGDMPLIDLMALGYPDTSKNKLRKWIQDGRIAVEGRTAKNASQIVKKEQTIEVGTKKKLIDGGIELLYEDRHLIVINKPEGMLSVASETEFEETAHSYLKERVRPKRVFVVHRLDQDTSGVMLFAYSDPAYTGLKELFKAHKIVRKYMAIVEGHLEQSAGTWSSYMYEDATYNVRETADKSKGELAITHYRVLGTSKKYSCLECTLETGKKNQIRVHCQSAGHPVAGDKKYGAESDPLNRLCLHAFYLEFEHPVLKKPMRFSADAPPGFSRIIGKLKDD